MFWKRKKANHREYKIESEKSRNPGDPYAAPQKKIKTGRKKREEKGKTIRLDSSFFFPLLL